MIIDVIGLEDFYKFLLKFELTEYLYSGETLGDVWYNLWQNGSNWTAFLEFKPVSSNAKSHNRDRLLYRKPNLQTCITIQEAAK